MNTPTPTQAAAIRCYRAGQAAARKMIAADPGQHAAAHARLLPWLAMAAEAGADLPDLFEDAQQVWPVAQTVTIRRYPGDPTLPQRADWAPTSHRARKLALDKISPASTPAETEWARDLCTLATAFGLPPYTPGADEAAAPAQPEKAAA